jgi:predicted kinase
MHPTLYILCGLPYSGKTTFARQFAQQSGFPLVSIDGIRESLGFFWGTHEATSADWKRIFETVEAELAKHLQTGRNVIHDSTNHDKASRDKWSAFAKRLQCEAKIVFVDASVEVVEARRQANLLSHDRAHLPEASYQSALETFEAPTPYENVVKAEDLVRRENR